MERFLATVYFCCLYGSVDPVFITGQFTQVLTVFLPLKNGFFGAFFT